jgi:hypothetical protein
MRLYPLCNILSDGRIDLSFTTVVGPGQRSHSLIRVPRDSWPHFNLSDSILLQSERSGPRIYIPQDQDGPVVPPGNGFPFHRLLRLAGLHWRYLTTLKCTVFWNVTLCSPIEVQLSFGGTSINLYPTTVRSIV